MIFSAWENTRIKAAVAAAQALILFILCCQVSGTEAAEIGD